MGNKGYKKSEIMEFAYEKSGETIQFPVGTVCGNQEGPTLVVLGGMHGSEFGGIQAAIDLYNEIQPEMLKGTLIIGTIYNMPAFLNHTGFLVPQDGKNPMSTFPGKLDGSYGEVMAYHFHKHVLSKADYFVELHGGDIPEALSPFVVALETGDPKVDQMMQNMAMVYNIPLVIHRKVSSDDNLGAAYRKAALQGIPSILSESGQQGILDLSEAKVHLDGLKNIMIMLGMIVGKVVDTTERIALASHGGVRNEIPGMWYPFVKLNQRVLKDEVVGEIRNYFGVKIADIKAPIDGIITVIRTSPSVGMGNVLIELHHISETLE